MSAGVSSGGVARTPMKVGKVFRRFFRNNFERSISPLWEPTCFFQHSYIFSRVGLRSRTALLQQAKALNKSCQQFSWRVRQRSVAMVVVAAAPVVKSPTPLLNVHEKLSVLFCPSTAKWHLSSAHRKLLAAWSGIAEPNWTLRWLWFPVTRKGYPNTSFTPTSAQEVVRLRIYIM